MPTIDTPGTYRAIAMSAQLGKAGTGTPQVAIAFQTEDGQHITAFCYLSEKAADRTMESLRLCGWEGDDVRDLSGVNGTCEVDIVVEEEEYEGNMRCKVKWINAPGGGGVKVEAMPEKEAAAFAARMKAKAQASRATGPKPTRTGKPAAAAAQKRDEHPFAPGNNEDGDLPF